MQRINSDGKVESLFGTGKHGFTDGNPVAGVEATLISADWQNTVQEEIANAIEGPGVGLNAGDNRQLLHSISRIQLANWTVESSGVAENLNAVMHLQAGYGEFTAVGDNGTAVSSRDGVHWGTESSVASITSAHLRAVHGRTQASPYVYVKVIVGDNGTIITNGTNYEYWWAAQTSGTTKHLYGLTYGNGLWVAVGQTGEIRTSSDGVAWVAATSGTTWTLRGVTYGNGRFFAVGDHGTYRTSTDGVTWTGGTASIFNFTGVAYRPGLGYIASTDGGVMSGLWHFKLDLSGNNTIGNNRPPGATVNAVAGDNLGRAVGVAASAGSGGIDDARVLAVYDTLGAGGGGYPVPVEDSVSLRGVTSGPNVWIAVGDDGTILRSMWW